MPKKEGIDLLLSPLFYRRFFMTSIALGKAGSKHSKK
jgi:hypothetical protein